MKDFYLAVWKNEYESNERTSIIVQDKFKALSLLENYNVYKIEKMREIIGAEVIIDYVD